MPRSRLTTPRATASVLRPSPCRRKRCDVVPRLALHSRWCAASFLLYSLDVADQTMLRAQTNKAWVSPATFHELSAGQLDCYVEYCNYIFLVGCVRCRARNMATFARRFARQPVLFGRLSTAIAARHTGKATRWRTGASPSTASSGNAARCPRATSSPVRRLPPRSASMLVPLGDHCVVCSLP